MKNSMILAAAAALALVACAKVETIQNTTDEVSFGVYVPKTVATKTGATGQTTTTSIKRSEANGGGFGVFTYYTDDKTYAEAVAANTNKPNFMYNQGVFWNSTAWKYDPVKYWPNEYGTGANSTGTDHLSFFAYAPYVASASGTGITALYPANNATGDPKVAYTLAENPAEVVDLCWAVDAADGLPWIDETKQTVNGTVNFLFKHALARFNVNVRGWFDAVRPDEGDISSNDIDAKSRITIEKVEIKGNLYTFGVLNLNNTTANVANWALDPAGEKTLTISNTDIAESLRATVNGETSFPSAKTGVTKTNVSIFTGAAPADTDVNYFTMIPKASESKTLSVKITYYVTTQDANLENGISCVKNVISKDITFDEFVNNKKYSLNIVLGMTTVKLEATVDDWDLAGTAKDIDLPVNTNA